MAQNPQSPNLPVSRSARSPRLRPVEEDGTTPSLYKNFMQLVDEAVAFNGRSFCPGDEWIGAVLFPNNLGISFAERIADIPNFVAEVESLIGSRVSRIKGTASEAMLGDPPLLGDWIKSGTFDKDRLGRKFEQTLGGKWQVKYNPRNPRATLVVYDVEISRIPGT